MMEILSFLGTCIVATSQLRDSCGAVRVRLVVVGPWVTQVRSLRIYSLHFVSLPEYHKVKATDVIASRKLNVVEMI